jgi:hypothetical protein
MSPEGLLPCSQQPSTGPYPEQLEPTGLSHPVYLSSILTQSSHLNLCLRSSLFLPGKGKGKLVPVLN